MPDCLSSVLLPPFERKPEIALCESSEHLTFPVGLSLPSPQSPTALSLKSHKRDSVLVAIVLIDTVFKSGWKRWGRAKVKVPPGQFPSPLMDRIWRRRGHTCMFPSQVVLWVVHFVSFMSLKLLFCMPGEQSGSHLVLLLSGFSGVDET